MYKQKGRTKRAAPFFMDASQTRYNCIMKYPIPNNDEELLRQCRVQTFRGSGPGGQSVNTADSAVRLIHEPSGIVVVSRQERSQLMNKRAALMRLRKRLKEANHVPRSRVATQPSKAADQRRLAAKRQRSLKKQQRSRPIDE